jgi:hypothetical protein
VSRVVEILLSVDFFIIRDCLWNVRGELFSIVNLLCVFMLLTDLLMLIHIHFLQKCLSFIVLIVVVIINQF